MSPFLVPVNYSSCIVNDKCLTRAFFLILWRILYVMKKLLKIIIYHTVLLSQQSMINAKF
jgi:hypothetical protein